MIIIQNIIIIMMAKLVSAVGSKLFGFAMSYYILKLTGSGLAFGISLALVSLPKAIFSPFAGILSDRLNKKKILIYSDVVSGAIMLLLFVTVLAWPIKISYIYLSVFLLSVVETIFSTNLSASIPNLVRPELLKKVNSLDQGISSFCDILGPVLGGVIFVLVDIRFFILLNGISFLFSALCELALVFNQSEAAKNEDEKIHIVKELKAGWLYIKSVRFLYLLVGFAVLFNFTFHLGFTVCFAYIATNIAKLSAWQFGMARGALSIGAIMAAFYLSVKQEKEEEKESQYPTRSIIGLAITLIFLGVVGSKLILGMGSNVVFALLLLVGFIIGVFIVFVNVPVTVLLQKVTEQKYLGRVMGFVASAANLMAPLSVIISGYLVDKVPTYVLPSIGGVLLILAAIKMSILQKPASEVKVENIEFM